MQGKRKSIYSAVCVFGRGEGELVITLRASNRYWADTIS